ncbi:lysylphosphatidylglycerol synthase domain-containing protein [Marisediminicola sp. LYQ85]|uniref:lysylphosphatidylglycerol synthase domain-containing protein n=1 Tax=Marisediminicola sp. LYQ85 TaxID=3391062 RepID=UPI0039832F98
MRVPQWLRSKKLWRRVATVVIVGVVGVLFTLALVENWAQVREQDLSFSWLWIVAIVLFAAAVPLSGVLWAAIVNRLSEPGLHVSVRDGVMVHSASWLLKYIPGQVGSLVNKVMWGAKQGFSRALIVITFIYENVFLQVASIVPSAIILLVVAGPDAFALDGLTIVLAIAAAGLLVVVLTPPLFRRVLDVVSRRAIKRDLPPAYFLPVTASAGFILAFTLPRVVNAFGFVAVVASFRPIEPSDWALLSAAYVLAGAIGILAVFVPSGLGVREGVLAVCLVAGGFTIAESIVAAILARLLSTAADAVVAMLYGSLRALSKKDS